MPIGSSISDPFSTEIHPSGLNPAGFKFFVSGGGYHTVFATTASLTFAEFYDAGPQQSYLTIDRDARQITTIYDLYITGPAKYHGDGSALTGIANGAAWGSITGTLTDQTDLVSYINTAVTGLLDFKGATDCSASPNYPAASKGDTYIVSVAGKIGGASGTSVDAGDTFFATADNVGGTEASVGTSWGHIEHNLPALGALATLTPGTGIATALAINTGSAGAPVLFNGAGGTPSLLTLTNAIGLPAAGVSGTAVTQTTLSNATLPASFTTLAASGAFQYATQRSPALIATGAGTEASPFTHADTTGGIQTCIDALAAARGGCVSLGSYRFNITAADGARISTPSIAIRGDGIGFNIDPNGETEGINGAKLHTTTHGVRLGVGGSKRGGILLRDFYIFGPSKTGGAQGVTMDGQLDQPRLENINLSGLQYAIYISSVCDAGHFTSCTALNNGYGAYLTSGATTTYTKFDKCEIADNDNNGIHVVSGAICTGMRINDCTLVRNARTLTTNGANIYLAASECVISNCSIRNAGHDNIGGGNVAADGIIIDGDRNVVAACQVTDNSNGCGIRVKGDNNVISGCQFSGNTTDIIIESTADGTVIIGAGNITITNNGTNTLVLNGRPSSLLGMWPTFNPDVWYKASDLRLSDADGIATFYESSGNSRAASQATSGKRPTYKIDIVNGKPVARFTLANAQLLASGWTPAYGSGDMTFFAVAKLSASAGPGKNAIFGNLQNSGSFNGFSLETTSAGKIEAGWRIGGSNKLVTESGTSSGSFFIATMQRSNGIGQLWINGISAGTVAASGSIDGEGFAIGAFRTSENAEYWNGDIVEIIGYGSTIPTAQRQAIESELSKQCNVTVTPDEVVSSLIASGSAVSLTTVTPANVTSISLTAGDWNVTGNINFALSAATCTQKIGSIGSTSATLSTDGSESNNGVQSTLLSANDGLTVARKRVSITTTTTVYLVGQAAFSAGAVSAFGGLFARRVR